MTTVESVVTASTTMPVKSTSKPVPITNGGSLVDKLPSAVRQELQSLCQDYLGDEVGDILMKVATRPADVEGNFPHHTTAEGRYVYEPSWWWTSGFFPGSLWLLYERSLKMSTSSSSSLDILAAARRWQVGMEKEQHNTRTHDLGFMIMPSFFRDWRLRGDTSSRDIVITAARSLASRWSEEAQMLRSWDSHVSKRFDFARTDTDFLVIIDNMMNLDLLYVGAELTGDSELARIATVHAYSTLQRLVRADGSTYHLINLDQQTGAVKGRYTVQGDSDESAWTRGQAWALHGFATAYRYTGDAALLDAALRLATYFCRRVAETSAAAGEPGAVVWDFDAPCPPLLLDTSAAMIACSGVLLLWQLTGGSSAVAPLLPTMVSIMTHCAHKDRAPAGADTILDHATVNSNRNAIEPVRDRGLVYADYYFVEVGNRLLEMGFTR